MDLIFIIYDLLFSSRELPCQQLWREDRICGEPAAAAVTQLTPVQFSRSQTFWKHSEKMADQSSSAPWPKQLYQEAWL